MKERKEFRDGRLSIKNMEIYLILIRDVGASFIFVVAHFATDLSLKTQD